MVQRLSDIRGLIDKTSTTYTDLKNDITAIDVRVDALEDGAYQHPESHPPSIIAETSSDQFVSAAQITSWDSKAEGNHNHNGVYEPVITKNTGFNLNLGTIAGTVSEGNHNHNTTYAQKTTSISTGTGLLGGGDLSTNRTFSIDRADTTLARAHTSNDYVMTPVRTFEAFNQYGLGDRAKQVTDLNAIVKSGLYMADVGVTGNPATDGWVTVLHIEHGGTGWSTQQAHCFSGALYLNRVWYRHKNNGVWQSWHESVSLTSSGSNTNGYYRIWSDGYKEQWDYVISNNANSSMTINFPVAFADVAGWNVQITDRADTGDTGGVDYAAGISQARSVSSFTLTRNSNHYGFFWVARGY